MHREELRRPRRGDGRRPAAGRAGHLPQAVHRRVRPRRSDPAPGRGSRERTDYEGELAVVIGRVCSDVPASRVPEVIFGYTCANDVTARDLQAKDGQWTRAKGFDTFCPLGPWIETDLDPADLALTTTPQRRGQAAVQDLAAAARRGGDHRVRQPGDDAAAGRCGADRYSGRHRPDGQGRRGAVTIEGIGTLSNPVADRD